MVHAVGLQLEASLPAGADDPAADAAAHYRGVIHHIKDGLVVAMQPTRPLTCRALIEPLFASGQRLGLLDPAKRKRVGGYGKQLIEHRFFHTAEMVPYLSKLLNTAMGLLNLLRWLIGSLVKTSCL